MVVYECNGKLFRCEADAYAEQVDVLGRDRDTEILMDENMYGLACELYGYRNPGSPSAQVTKREVN